MYAYGVLGLREEILAYFHNSKEWSYSRWLRAYVIVKHFFYYEGLKNEVKTMVVKCDTYQKVKYDQWAPMRLLHPMPIPNRT